MFNDRERATVLAALRFWQCRGPVTTSRQALPLSVETWAALHDIATDTGQFTPLKDDDIDRICERLSAGEEPSATLIAKFQRQVLVIVRGCTRRLGLRSAWAAIRDAAGRRRPASIFHSPQPHADSMDPSELDEWCCDCQLPGFFCSGVPGITAHVEDGQLSAQAKVERCDACRRYPSDQAALAKLRELGFDRSGLPDLHRNPKFSHPERNP